MYRVRPMQEFLRPMDNEHPPLNLHFIHFLTSGHHIPLYTIATLFVARGHCVIVITTPSYTKILHKSSRSLLTMEFVRSNPALVFNECPFDVPNFTHHITLCWRPPKRVTTTISSFLHYYRNTTQRPTS